jgi:hypothetical protein
MVPWDSVVAVLWPSVAAVSGGDIGTKRASARRSLHIVNTAADHLPLTRSGYIAVAHSSWLTTPTSMGVVSACLPGCADGDRGREYVVGVLDLDVGACEEARVPAAKNVVSATRHNNTSGSCSSTLDVDAMDR